MAAIHLRLCRPLTCPLCLAFLLSSPQHAGLECGLFKLAYPDLDCVSIGPTIHGAHSPQEYLEIDTVAPFFSWLQQSIVNITKDSVAK